MMDFFHFFFPRGGKKPGRQPEKKTGDRPADRTPVPPEEKTEHKQEHAPRREPQIMESVSPIAEPEIEPWEENARMTYTDCERRVIQHYIHDAFGPIGRTYYDLLALLPEHGGKFADGGGFANAVHAHYKDHIRLFCEVEGLYGSVIPYEV